MLDDDAILLNEAYYDLLKNGQIVIDSIPVLSVVCLISFKGSICENHGMCEETGKAARKTGCKIDTIVERTNPLVIRVV